MAHDLASTEKQLVDSIERTLPAADIATPHAKWSGVASDAHITGGAFDDARHARDATRRREGEHADGDDIHGKQRLDFGTMRDEPADAAGDVVRERDGSVPVCNPGGPCGDDPLLRG